MKYTYLTNICLLRSAYFARSFPACDYADGEGSGSENAVYMETPDNKGIVNFTLEPDGGITYLTPRLANISQSPVTIQVGCDKEALD